MAPGSHHRRAPFRARCHRDPPARGAHLALRVDPAPLCVVTVGFCKALVFVYTFCYFGHRLYCVAVAEAVARALS